MSPNNKPSTGTPIHRKTQSIKGAMDVFDDSFPNIPGATSKNKMIIPNNFPIKLCLSLKTSCLGVIMDSFHETFK